MTKSNIQVGKFYKEKSLMMDAFRYIHVSRVDENTIHGEIITMYGVYISIDCYNNTGNWIEVDQQEFEQRREFATNNLK